MDSGTLRAFEFYSFIVFIIFDFNLASTLVFDFLYLEIRPFDLPYYGPRLPSHALGLSISSPTNLLWGGWFFGSIKEMLLTQPPPISSSKTIRFHKYVRSRYHSDRAVSPSPHMFTTICLWRTLGFSQRRILGDTPLTGVFDPKAHLTG